MTIRVWVWLRGEFLLESFLPLDFSVSKSEAQRDTSETGTPQQSTAIEGAHALVDECQLRNVDKLSATEWISVAGEIGIDDALGEAVFRNASGEDEHATLPSLALHLLLIGLEYFTCYQNENISLGENESTNRTKHKLTLDEFIGVLCRCATECSRSALKRDCVIFSEHQLNKFLTSMDLLFEGMTEDDETVGGRDEIVQFSQIAKKLWLKGVELSLRNLTTNMRKCLIQEPFQIDDLAVNTPSCSPRRVTSLTNTRRKVTITGWQRFQLLSKAVYKDVHLRISCNQSQSMLVAPWRSRSVIVYNVKSCPAIVLGPVQGAVILKEVHDANISVACKQLCVWNCTNITVFLHCFRPPVIRGCSAVKFAAFNVSYEGLSEEMEAAGLKAKRYHSIRHLINLDDSDVSTLPACDYFIQPVPMINNDADVNELLEKIPVHYRQQWESAMKQMKTLSSDTSPTLPLKKSDLIYLRGKIVNDQ